MPQSAQAKLVEAPNRQENQRVAKRVTNDHDVVRLLSSDEIAEASDFYDDAPCTD